MRFRARDLLHSPFWNSGGRGLSDPQVGSLGVESARGGSLVEQGVGELCAASLSPRDPAVRPAAGSPPSSGVPHRQPDASGTAFMQCSCKLDGRYGLPGRPTQRHVVLVAGPLESAERCRLGDECLVEVPRKSTSPEQPCAFRARWCTLPCELWPARTSPG